jgi:hypothetical protein
VLRQGLPGGWGLGVAVGIDACPTTVVATTLRGRNLAVRNFPKPVGPYVVFNSLAYFDRSDVLVRFDADDLMLQGYLKTQLELLDSTFEPTITQTWSIYVDPELRPCAALLADGTFTSSDGRRSRPSDGQFLMTRSVWTRLGGFRAWPCHADTEFMRRAFWSGISIKAVPKHLYLRRIHSASLTSSLTTGYRSRVRHSYAEAIETASRRYASGEPPECIHAVTSWYAPLDIWSSTTPRDAGEC